MTVTKHQHENPFTEDLAQGKINAVEDKATPKWLESAFLKACRLEAAACTPVWLMRQAGRFMAEFRALRAKRDLLQLCKSPELACEISIMPVEKIGVDAAIIFADILLPLEAMGARLEYSNTQGPVISNPVKLASDIDALRMVEAEETLSYVLHAIKLTRDTLDAALPLIGFAGAPFTLASYLIEGGSSKTWQRTKSFMYSEPGAWKRLMTLLAQVTSNYLNAQIASGVQAVQLFDSWVGCLSPDDYCQFVLPYTKQVVVNLTPGIPLIHFGVGTGNLLKLMKEAGGNVIGLDWRVNLEEAWLHLGYDVAVQGNLDPAVLLADRALIKQRVKRIIEQIQHRPGHIFNLGHGVLPHTNVDHVRFLVDVVHELGRH